MLRIRLSRAGRKKQPFFKIVVIPRGAGTKSRKYKEELGTHDPVNKETVIDAKKARSWIAKGAQPTDTVHNLLVKHGVITGRKKAVHDKDPVDPEPKEEEKEGKEEQSKEETKQEEVEKKEEDKEKEKDESDEDEQDENEEEAEEDEEGKEEEKKEDEDESELESLDLTTRIINSLEEAGIDTIGKLKKKSEEDLGEVKGLGPKSIEKIMDELK